MSRWARWRRRISRTSAWHTPWIAGRHANALAPRMCGVGLAAALKHPCSADDDDCDDGTLEGAILGFGLGMLAAMVIDTALIARPVKAKPAVTWVPQVAVTPQQVGLGVVGRF